MSHRHFLWLIPSVCGRGARVCRKPTHHPQRNHFRRQVCRQDLTALCLFLSALAGIGVAHAEIKPDFMMDSNPKLTMPGRVKNFNRDFQGTWIAALKRPEVDLQRMSAETIARAHLHGIPGMAEAIPELERIVTADSTHPAARFAAARALVALDSRDSAEKLLQAAQAFGADLRQLVEPALAKWDFAPARAIWNERLNSPKTRPRDFLLAIRGLGQVRDVTALPALLSVAHDLLRQSDLRIEAATAAGQLAETGLESDAEKLAQDARSSKVVNRLCAIHLLARHQSESARRLLLELATDKEPANAAAALRRLNAIDPSLILPLAETAMKSQDQYVREEGAFAYYKLPTVERMRPLAQLLDDPHPAVRRQICSELFRLAQQTELRPTICDASMEMLNGDHWQGQEQAALLLGSLEHQPASVRLVQLLESPRSEVSISSAWGLRKVADPITAAPIIDKIKRQTVQRKQASTPELDTQVAHLFEACKQINAVEVMPQLLEYVPKNPVMGERSRSAAIWTLGWFHAGNPDKKVATLLIGRVTDAALMPPESFLVKQFAAISLARMKAVEHAPAIRAFLQMNFNTTLGISLRWAMKELTEEEFPPVEPSEEPQGAWFLEPLLIPAAKK